MAGKKEDLLTYDWDFLGGFHSPGIEPWITGILKKVERLGWVLDIGCGFGFIGFMLRSYFSEKIDRLVGVDIDADRIRRLERLNVYDELYVADIRKFNPGVKYDTILAIDVLQELEAGVLEYIEKNLLKENGVMVLVYTRIPRDSSVQELIRRGYSVYRSLFRGLILIRLPDYKIILIYNTIFFKLIKYALYLSIPILKKTRFFDKSIIAYKT